MDAVTSRGLFRQVNAGTGRLGLDCGRALPPQCQPTRVGDKILPLYVWYFIYMKAIQITLDDALLARLDADEEVQRDGRSAVLRRGLTVTAPAAQTVDRRIKARGYRRARGLREFESWEHEGVWPEP